MKVNKNDWAFKIDVKTGNLEMHIPKKPEYSFDEMTIVAVSMMRFSQAIGAILDDFLKDTQKIKMVKGEEHE